MNLFVGRCAWTANAEIQNRIRAGKYLGLSFMGLWDSFRVTIIRKISISHIKYRGNGEKVLLEIVTDVTKLTLLQAMVQKKTQVGSGAETNAKSVTTCLTRLANLSSVLSVGLN